MFCTVKHNKNKYVVYLSERVREGGKVKSKDKYLFSLEPHEIENKAYIEWSQYTALSEKVKELVFNKLNNISVPLHNTTRNEPLQATTQEKSLHITTGIEVGFDNTYKVVEYNVYIKGKFIRRYDSLDMENVRLGIIMITFREECKNHGIDTSCDDACEVADILINLYEYHQDKKKEIEKVREETANYYTNTILALQLKIAELENNCSGSRRNVTTSNPTRVKKIYRALANKLHPDNGGSDELMQMLNELKDMIN